MSALIIQNGKHKGRKITLPDKEVVLGRDEDCFIRLTSTEVSRKHCSLRPTARGILVRDMASQNGTQVNSVPITEVTLLQPGDLLRVGPFSFQVDGPRPAKSTSDIDDTIAEWLSEGDTSTDLPKVDDTTIVKGPDVPRAAPPEPQPSEPEPSRLDAGKHEANKPEFHKAESSKTESKLKHTFGSLAEEAQDIIRRHLELVAQRSRK